MIKMIVSDMDGTLLKDHLTITPFSIATLQKAKDQGIIIVYATGRPFPNMKKYIQESPFLDYVALNNGSAIYSVHTKELLYKSVLSMEHVKILLEYADRNNLSLDLFGHDNIYSRGEARHQFFLNRNKYLEKEFQVPFTSVDSFDFKDDIYKIMIVEENLDNVDKYRNDLEQLGDFTVVQSEAMFIDIIPKGISKGHAVNFLAELEDISLRDIAAFGDQENDIPMLELVGESYAMKDGFPKAILAAKHIAECSSEDGVAKAILKYLK